MILKNLENFQNGEYLWNFHNGRIFYYIIYDPLKIIDLYSKI